MDHNKPSTGWHGIIYWNPDDKRMFVPKRFGIGWTVNFANPRSVLAFIGLIIVVTVTAGLL